MAITPTDFEKIWSSNASTPAYTFTDSDYLEGWDFVGNLPPTRAQWNAIQKRTDEKMKYVFDNFGAPLIANTVAEMTLQNRVYVYTGSEVGYTAGDWYYYDAGTSAWVDGGVYNAVAIVTDTTLTQAGVPADAKATGDKFDVITGRSYNLFNASIATYERGYYNNDGEFVASAVSSHTTNYIPVDGDTTYYIYGTIGTSTSQNAIYFYDSQKNWISRYVHSSNPNGFPFTTPSNCRYILLQYVNSVIDFDSIQITKGADKKPYLAYYTGYDGVARYNTNLNTDKIGSAEQRLASLEGIIVISPNILDLDSPSQDGAVILHDGTIGGNSPGWVAYTDYIPIEPNTAYTVLGWDGNSWSDNTSAWFAFYNADKICTSGAIISTNNPAVSSANDAYMRISIRKTFAEPMLLKVADVDKIGDGLDSYMAPGEVVVKGLKNEDDMPIVVLPSKCRAVVGSQFNIYTENTLLINNSNDYCYHWTITPTLTHDVYSDCLRFTPTVDDIGTYTVTLQIKRKRDWETVLSQSMELEVVANTTRTAKKVLFIGDSLTNAGYYPYEIQHNLSADGVESIGTVVSHPWFNNRQVTVNHEGRGGWSISDYVTKAQKSGITNAFWNPSTNKFDFDFWLTTNNFAVPDIIFINLGTNGVYEFDANINGINEMITSIRSVSATVPILISLITPPATQDGWTYANHGGSANQFKVFELTLNNRYIEEYDGREDEHIYLSPVYFNLDRYHDYNTAQFPVSARNPELVTMQTNNVHPSVYGYLKFADVYWAMVQAILQ